jgi:hypothetical protein
MVRVGLDFSERSLSPGGDSSFFSQLLLICDVLFICGRNSFFNVQDGRAGGAQGLDLPSRRKAGRLGRYDPEAQ